jgi:hypothetical protein
VASTLGFSASRSIGSTASSRGCRSTCRSVLGELRLHLSEHHGDGSPGAQVRIEVTGLRDYHAAISAKGYSNMRPGLERPEWGGTEMTVIDPAGNRLTFAERAPA